MKSTRDLPACFRATALLGLPLVLGLLLRLYALRRLFLVVGDSLIYGGIAKNLLLHGQFALAGAGSEIYPTLIRLPGYPFLLALVFRLAGMENYFAAACLQIAVELAGCLLLADFVRRIAPPALARRAFYATLWIACLCPFTASYTAMPMAETPTLFAIALALWSAACFHQRPAWPPALAFTFAIVFAALLRPDGALVAIALAPAALLAVPRGRIAPRRLACIALACTLLALTPFALWTARNERVFHVFEPLAPRLAIDPGEDPHLGYEAWVKSWCLDFVSTYDIYWNVPGDRFDLAKLPARAFDSPAQYAQTAALAGDYNSTGEFTITPEMDARFAALARQRAQDHPWRTHLWLPLGRVADMWFRPRVENLPIDLDWWNYNSHDSETVFSWAWAGLNLLYLAAAIAGLGLRPPFGRSMLAYLLLRSALLLTVQAPEARYTLECFPFLCVLAGLALAAALPAKQKTAGSLS
ncbi:MAG: glycosyltransferase family 39 protein [Terracidiphilus sp.]|nr:glycosyltransferase family 39 protein [Terracidiphilus sp.]